MTIKRLARQTRKSLIVFSLFLFSQLGYMACIKVVEPCSLSIYSIIFYLNSSVRRYTREVAISLSRTMNFVLSKRSIFNCCFFHYNSFLLEIEMLKLFTFPQQNPQTCESSCFKIREDYILGIKNLLKFNVRHVFSNNIEFIYFFISIYLIFFSICFLFVCLFTLSSKLTKDFFFHLQKNSNTIINIPVYLSIDVYEIKAL